MDIFISDYLEWRYVLSMEVDNGICNLNEGSQGGHVPDVKFSS